MSKTDLPFVLVHHRACTATALGASGHPNCQHRKKSRCFDASTPEFVDRLPPPLVDDLAQGLQ